MLARKFVNLIIILSLNWMDCASLLFPQYSVLQLTMSLSMPVEIPDRKYFTDWGFQMNYDMPYNLSSFFNAPIWPGLGRRSARSLNSDYNKYAEVGSNLHQSDMTAGELYASLENVLVGYGLHETCVLRSVCELARHPFDDDHNNILAEVVSFALSPSTHEAFADNELVYKKTYEAAELSGFRGEDCQRLYPLCKTDLLEAISKIMYI